ncbi:MAG: hypothetical protein AAF449_01555 [Myxococcota bacterium]
MKYVSYSFGSLAIGALFVSFAQAEPPAIFDHGTQIHAPLEIAEQFSRQASQKKPPLRPGRRLAPSEAKPLTAQGKLHEVDDGYVRLEVALTPERAEVLRRLGAKDVVSAERIRNHTIFQDRYYRDFRVAPPAGEQCGGCAAVRIEGPDIHRIQRKVGENVTLKLARDQNGQPWVVDLKL